MEGEAVLEDRILDLEEYILDFDGDWWNRNKNKNSIFLLSKQISAKALDVLYGDDGMTAMLEGVEPASRKIPTGRMQFRARF